MSQTFFEDDDKTERERERETKKQNERVASSTSSSSSSIFAHIHSVWEKHTTPTNASYLKKYFLFGYSTQLLSAIPHRLSPTLILSKSTSSKTVPPSETGGIGGGGIFFFPDGESRCFLFFCCWCCVVVVVVPARSPRRARPVFRNQFRERPFHLPEERRRRRRNILLVFSRRRRRNRRKRLVAHFYSVDFSTTLVSSFPAKRLNFFFPL